MNLKQLLEGLEYQTKLSDTEIKTVTGDSRQVEKGSLFVCIVGEKSDGHKYAEKAIENGAEAVLCQQDLGLDNQIIVTDSRYAYGIVCRNFFGKADEKLRLIGITGTNGKTTITYLLKHVLESCGKKVGLIGTIQTMIDDVVLPAQHTTPDPFQLHSIFNRMVKAGCEFAVMEVSSHALAQQRTVGCHFECGVFTNLTQDHLDYHGTMEEYYKAKKMLFDNSDFAILNYDDIYSKRLMQEIKIPYLTYSATADLADYTAKAVRGMPTGSRFTFIGKDIIGRISFPMPGSYSVSNAMATAATAIQMGCDVPTVCKALTDCPGVKGRTEVIPVEAEFSVIRDYAHSPDGLEKVITALKQFSVGRVITLFGCAGERDRTKRNKMSEIVSRLSDLVILTSDNPRSEDPQQIIDDAMDGLKKHKTPYKIFIDRYEAIVWAVAECKKDDILLLAGKGHEDYQVLDFGTVNFDEKAIVQQLLRKK